MNPLDILFNLVFGCLLLAGIIKSLITIVRFARAEVIWGEIVNFTNLGMPLIKAGDEPEAPDYRIEVKYEYDGTTHYTHSVIKKEVHYEKGAKIKVYISGGKVESAMVDYNIKVSAYVQLITMVFLCLFLAFRLIYGA